MRHSILFSTVTISVFIFLWVIPAAAQQRPAEYANPAVSDQTDPAYWFDLGGLFATYGNYMAAVEAYQKALALNPNMHQAFFASGVAYMEMGNQDEALNRINRAIDLAPQVAHYYYGRARVILLSGQPTQARDDFRKAAEMGDPDARAYLQKP